MFFAAPSSDQLPAFVQTIANAVEPWRTLYSDSKMVGGLVMFAHLGAILLGGGFAVAADRTTLRVLKMGESARRAQLEELRAVHRPVAIGLFVLAVSGLLLVASDIETFVVSPPFWVKIGAVTLLLINGLFLFRTESALRRQGGVGPGAEALWGRLKTTSILSLILWTLTVLAGTFLSIAA